MFSCGRCGGPIRCSYTSKGSRRYRYYVCRAAQENGGDVCAGAALPAAKVERFVIAAALDGTVLNPPERRERVRRLVERV